MSRNSLIYLLALFISASASFSLPLAHYQLAHKQAHASAWLYQYGNSLELAQVNPANVRQFATLGYVPAQLDLATDLVHSGEFRGAKLYWQRALNHSSGHQQAWFSLVDALSQQHRWSSVELIAQQRALPHDVEQSMRYYTGEVSLTKEFAQAHGFHLSLPQPSEQCAFNVLTIASSASGVDYMQTLLKQYAENPEPGANLMCFSKPVYIGNTNACSVNERGFAQCRWDWLANDFEQAIEYDFAVAVAAKGFANVQAGVMHISESAPYHVFLHELMHFAGFVDEYPGPQKQQGICAHPGQHYVNLIVAKQAPADWQRSSYCQNGLGFKPSAATSIMEHSHVGLSEQYRTLWQQQLQNKGVELLKLRDFLAHYMTSKMPGSEQPNEAAPKANAQFSKAIAD